MCNAETSCPNRKIWKVKIPLKIEIFMLLVENDAILTKNNLAKRNWQGDMRYSFAKSRRALVTCSLNAQWLNKHGKGIWYIGSAKSIRALLAICSLNAQWLNIHLEHGGHEPMMVGGAPCHSSTFSQFWIWVSQYMRGGFYMVVVAAIYMLGTVES